MKILSALLSIFSITAAAQEIPPVWGTYSVAETCTLVDDSSYKKSVDYTLAIETLPDKENGIRFMIPTHGIPDFVNATTANGRDFTFSQTFSTEDSTLSMYIGGNGSVRDNSLSMEYIMSVTGVWGRLQCSVTGRKNDVVGVEEKVQRTDIRVDVQNMLLLLPEQSLDEGIDFELFNTNGQRILSIKDVGNPTISIASLPAGLYLYRLTSRNRLLSTGKFLKGR